ncbi:unnamed protein product [Hermetia illucens]|uniref:CTCK domain-containing protein n=1 Tax=Hermetia illucens TaxID=343691 RepID=A0A7R8V8G8_HERIL|nr:uncharacterized protein LOC119660783 [Hermetia illucens]XP_037925493.1 uncharacterized protein LOC119660783 [Hermetia illucens]XP_037925494.1 uncharacterized protein LOC119660783 [Hermetia illucens]XP_037925496.1 uncharacterized protein LOC119660783 [Hermetia illucens]XP_037925497.1 uncharacterized protein LOC119660783 [Hermetia illucens]XP_037925498.1 uncharacterized protein LOC119660783 [Hermetia illucens]CAD7094047.1 unnamed protein product [Hermetia illucens]
MDLWPLCFFIVCTILTAKSKGAHREHKVHNIVLYPDKHSWCQTQQIKQVISYPGCKSEEIDNNVCVGACFSYSIPHTEPSDPGEVIVPYCDSCQPSDTTWHHVTLQCEKNSDITPPQLVKRVQIINNCSCSSCEGDHHNRYKTTPPSDTDDSDDFLIMQQNDVPDLLRLLNNRNETNTVQNSIHAENVKSLMNHKIVTLLKNIQEKNSRYDKDQLIDLLRTIQGPEHHKLSDEKIADFVESLNSENVELDLVRLREVLSKFERSKYFEKHRKYLLGGHHIDEDQRRQHRHHHHHPHHQMALNNNGESNPHLYDSEENGLIDGYQHTHQFDDKAMSDVDTINSEHVEHDSSHPSKEHQTDDIVIDSIINGHHGQARLSGTIPGRPLSTVTTSPSYQHTSVHHHQHQHHLQPQHYHHAGEEILGHGHLIKGPNGALVIEPDRIHEKLDVNSHELKPNHAGTLLSYSAAGQPLSSLSGSTSSSSSLSPSGPTPLSGSVAEATMIVEKTPGKLQSGDRDDDSLEDND